MKARVESRAKAYASSRTGSSLNMTPNGIQWSLLISSSLALMNLFVARSVVPKGRSHHVRASGCFGRVFARLSSLARLPVLKNCLPIDCGDFNGNDAELECARSCQSGQSRHSRST